MKKYTFTVLLLLFLSTILFGCRQSANANSDEKISVVATIFPQYDFVREIAGDNVDLTMLLPPGSESHSYEPTPQDIIKIKNCDVFICVGGSSEEWLKEIIESMDTSEMKVVYLMDMVDAVEEEIVEGMEEEHGHDDDHEDEHEEKLEYDEHVWTSPKNAKIIVQAISDMLCEVDAANASEYKKNTESYLAELDELDAAFQAAVDAGIRKTIVFGDRFPFRYFADAYGLEYYAAFPGCSTETEPSAATVAFLIDKVKAENIPVVFHIELSNEKMADAICEATGAKKLLLHSCHNISKREFERGVTYLDLMKANVEAIKEALE
ncbi:ABC transporter substrate-binding protein [Clostridium thermosuccinogenes]|jgi:zinc transport system substrate-binding protein|uniref:ABC transporter substrate-binding protein n=1 Tax=Clostridium thermosuccinogenes TaxID=84032 RepID=A0A2K2FBE2_9CLOT|nr:metal ABC transporter substrate-binding protein [Pseudoclostridium thermosuccinogenes]AUS97039.1 ABC transporter substrate-binding protein [Pseudoclostridium thermosuccinogenes]PNT96087.1 ABC transporter substrate-binding protein [Pseudoclostridium thermosuccinogenes]PNT97698.1 ABC transporter substrate-binding protein [Pseudoclostridium thermosuccinogenes]